MKDHAFHECDIASIWLPEDWKVVQPWPSLTADFGQGMISVSPELEDSAWDIFRESMENPLINCEHYELARIRLGPVEFTYTGFENIVQTHMLATNYLQCRWDLVFKDGSLRAIISIGGPGKFSDHEEVWTRVLKSFRFK